MIIFLKSILLPIFFTFVAAALEATSSLVKGISEGDNKFKVWLEERQSNGVSKETARLNQSANDIHYLKNIIDIESMASFDFPQFASIGIDLMVGAFCVDVITLVAPNGNNNSWIWAVLVGHLFMLVGVIFYYNKNLAVSPKKVKEKRDCSIIAIALGTIAMMAAFFVS